MIYYVISNPKVKGEWWLYRLIEVGTKKNTHRADGQRSSQSVGSSPIRKAQPTDQQIQWLAIINSRPTAPSSSPFLAIIILYIGSLCSYFIFTSKSLLDTHTFIFFFFFFFLFQFFIVIAVTLRQFRWNGKKIGVTINMKRI